MKNRFSTALLTFLSLALSVSSTFRIARAAEPDRELLTAPDRESVEAIEKLGATVRLLPVKKTDSANESPPNVIVLIGSKWTGKDDDLKSVAGLTTLQGVYVFGPGNVTNEALDKLRADRPEVTIVRRSAVMLGIQPRKVVQKGPKAKGVKIERVEKGSPALRAGIQPGDRLTEFDGKPVPDFDKLLELLLPLTPGQTVGARLERDGVTISVTVKFPRTISTDETGNGNAQKIPGQDNPVLKKILDPEVQITGEWRGSRLPQREGNVLTIEEEPGEDGSYRLEFYFWTDYGRPQREMCTGKLANGIIKMDKPSKTNLGLARDSYDVLYTVRVDGKEFLLPSVHAENLKSADELNQKIAYLLHVRREKLQ